MVSPLDAALARSPQARALLPPLVVALVAIVVIRPGLMPDVGFWDTAEFQTVAPVLGTAHPTGYPTYVILGFLANFLLAPLGEPAFRMNVFSLLCVAAAAAATALLVIRLTGAAPIGIAAGVGLATTPIAWNLATHADPHTLHLALVAILCLVLARWEAARRAAEPAADRWLVLAAVLFGLSAGNHSLTLLLAPPVGLYVLAVEPSIVRRPRFVAACAAALVGTLVLVYLELPLRAGVFRAPLVYARPETWDGFWYIALAEQFRGALHDPLGELPRKVADLASLASAQLGFLAPAAAAGFVATAIRFPRYALLTGSAMAVTTIFNAAYANADIGRYYLGPVLWAWTWLGILGGLVVEWLRAAWPGSMAATRRAVVATGLAALLVTPAVAGFESRAAAADRSRDTAARDWVTAVLSTIEDGAVVVSWWSTSTTLWYAQYVDGLRTDLTIVDDRTRLDLDYGEATDVIARFLDSRPVYVIRANAYDLRLVTDRYELEPLGAASARDVWRVVGRRNAG
jgi:hypothetical protein